MTDCGIFRTVNRGRIDQSACKTDSKNEDKEKRVKNINETYQIETRCIHTDEKDCLLHPYGAVAVPICQTATFSHPGIGESTGYDYSRESNPTRSHLEEIVRNLEKAEDAVACSSGMAAIALCFSLFDAGSHFVCSKDLYGGSVRLFQSYEKRGYRFTYVDTSVPEEVEQAVGKDTKALYIETPSNPMMKITDLHRMRELADRYGLLLIVDNTFLSPYFQNPIELGADLVLHSGTKFLCGHNDTIAGFVCTASKELAERLRFQYKTTGSCLSPFDSWLMIRGIKTLAVRQERQQENAMRIAEWLSGRKEIDRVYYPGLKEHPGYEINKKQARGFGSMISFHTDSEATARKLLQNVRIFTYAESLGGVESFLTYPMIQTHGDIPEETRRKLGITENFLRISVGIENAEDLIRDLERSCI